MIKKFSLVVVACFCFVLNGFGQTWTYDFGTATGTHPVSSISTSFLTGTPANGGTYRVRTGAGGGTIVLANPGTSLGTDSELQIQSANGTSTNKFGIYNWASPSTVAYFKAKIRTTSAGNGNLNFSLGINTTANDNQNYTNHYNNSIASFTISYTSGAISSVVRRINGTNQTITTSGFAKDTDQDIEVYANNGAASTTYILGGTTYTLNSKQWDLWMGGTKISPANGWPTAGTLGVNINLSGFYFFAESSTSNSAFIYLDDLEYSNTLPNNFVDYCNLQFPQNGNINVGTTFDVYAQAYEFGVTEPPLSQGANIFGDIGYSTTNTNPNTWTDWIPATYNNVASGNNDEYKATIPILPSGTYYYASRFKIGSGAYKYGGFSSTGGGFWSATNVSGILSVDTPDFVNLQFPGVGTIELGDAFDVYGQVYEQGVTPGAGQGLNIESEIGYKLGGATNTNPSGAGWTWQAAAYNATCSDCNDVAGVAQNDEYSLNIGSAINVPGTYSFATRFRINGGIWLYGGILADGSAGGVWNGTVYENGILTVNEPPLADVVITEIMYDTQSPPIGDDEWIEICNVSGSSQYLGNYKIKFNTTTLFTFPAATYIANGTCITVSLGSNGDAIFNNNCPFTPTFGISASTDSTNKLTNGVGPYTVSLFATNNTSVIDSVAYSNADGADGNGASLHVNDINEDNSTTTTNWQQVFDGGTAGINFLVSSCSALVPKLDVESNTYDSIANNGGANTGNNTQWGGVVNVGSSVNKTYFLRNEGYANLTVSSLTSSNPDWTFVGLPSFPFVMAPGALVMFEISFSPTSATPTARTGIITINSDDPTYPARTFNVKGTAGCPLYTGTLFPTSGPVGTEVTITSTQSLIGATATLNGQAVTVLSSSVGTLVVKIPDTVTSGGALIVTLAGGCTIINNFELIDNAIAGCEGSVSSAPGDIFISQLTDSGKDSVTYIEVYNGTGSSVNLNNYSIRVYNNGLASIINNTYNISLNNVNLLNGKTYVLAIGVTGANCSEHDFSNLADQQYSAIGVGINFEKNGDGTIGQDHIRLYKNSTHIDSWGVYRNQSWATTLNLGGKGANFMRKTDVPLPTTTYSNADWIIQDWGDNCSDLDYSDIGAYDFSVGTPPSVSVLTHPNLVCDISTSLSVTGTEGYNETVDGKELAYQWYHVAPGENDWIAVPDNDIYDDVTTNILQILNTLSLDGYQYFCQVRENTETCFAASNAIKLNLKIKNWNGSLSNDWMLDDNWTPSGKPTIENVVVISSISQSPILAGTPPLPPTGSAPVYAKTLILLNGAKVEVQAGQNLIVENCIINEGTIDLKDTANLVQVNEFDQNAGNGNFLMERIVNEVDALNYIYWSSPIAGFNISGIPGSSTYRYYWSPTATNANTTKGDWMTATGVMDVGVGYIVRVAGATQNLNVTLGGNGLGTPYNGTLTTAILKGNSTYVDPADDVNNYWNLIGNPYPSAIYADKFIEVNAAQLMDDDDSDPSVLGTIYLWKHQATPNPNFDDPFYENFGINYDGNNYVAYNKTGSNPSGQFDGNIASGQAFFVLMDDNTSTPTVTFTNAMRFGDEVTDAYNNSQFLRSASDPDVIINTVERNRIWLDLIAPNNSAVSTLIGYVTGATNEKDRLYDGYETNSTGLGFYSIVRSDHMGIQGRSLPFDINDTVPLGVKLLQTGTYTIAINQVDGLFENGQSIYLQDMSTNTLHNLRATPFTFQANQGTYNDRFLLRYTNTTLSIPDKIFDASLTIIELPNGKVKFSVRNSLDIKAIEIFDMLGRKLYNLQGNSPSEVYELSNLSQAAYMAKVTLSNGQVITKRAVKQK